MTTSSLISLITPPQLRTHKRKIDRPLLFSLLLSLLLHAGAAGYLLMRPRGVELVLQLQSGEEALDMEVGSAFDSAASLPTPDIPEARFTETQTPLPPEEKSPEDEELAPPTTSDLKGALEILEPEAQERVETEPAPEQPLTHTPERRYHRRQMQEESPDLAEPEALEPTPEPPEPDVEEPPEEAKALSEAHDASVESVAGAEAKPRGVIQRARPMASLVPVYPDHSRRMGEMGEVIIRAGIDASGRCSWAEVERSSGYATLDNAALDTVRRARFAPATEDGMPIAMEDRFLIEFQLR